MAEPCFSSANSFHFLTFSFLEVQCSEHGVAPQYPVSYPQLSCSYLAVISAISLARSAHGSLTESCRLLTPANLLQLLNAPLKQGTKPDTEMMPTVTATKDADVQLENPSSDHPVFQFEWNIGHRYANS